MYPGYWAQIKPDEIAVVSAATGRTQSWRELDARSNQIAHYLRSIGLQTGDHIALLLENHLSYFEIAWAAFRSGLYITCINRYLTVDEVAYIVKDSGARVIFSSPELAATESLQQVSAQAQAHLLVHGALPDWQSMNECIAQCPTEPLAEQPMGDSMLYSSGTTGRPKGIKRPLTGASVADGNSFLAAPSPYGFDDQSRYLSPAPLYHAAPFGFCMRTLSAGGTVIYMDRFDPIAALGAIEKFRITHSQWVPTMFVRFLKLPEAERSGFDLSSHGCAVHAAAPCPVAIKQQMIDWWGPILWEYYAGTERNGSTIINSEQWLAHPGSVGRAASGVIHICDETGAELAVGEDGLVYFEQAQRPFEYHNAAEKTASAQHPLHPNWTALGDVGHLDAEGYLYLTDRKAFMIISGGVNIYPQEIEDVMILHDDVQDVAVFGVPNPEFGEEVKAVVQLASGLQQTPELGEQLRTYVRSQLASYKVPRSVDFIDEMPRLPTGKLYKRILRDRYLSSMTTDEH
ncbi:MAG: acyl-CoA synthetase [Pseudomonadales bacterium]